MSAHDRMEILVRTPDEVEAEMIAGTLQEHGIKATTVGGFVSGFRAEAPGGVSVMVAQADAAKARELLTELERHAPEIDWSVVDFGDDSPVDEDDDSETERGEDEEQPGGNGPQQFTLVSLIKLQAAICIALWLWKTASQGATWPGLLLVPALFALVISGTILIATDFSAARRLALPLCQLFAVGFAAYLILFALRAILTG